MRRWARLKRILCLSLAAALMFSMLAGCGTNKIDNSGYIPTGDAILMEGQEPEDIAKGDEETQELTLAYYPDRSLNPLFGSDYTNRVLMSLMYQGLFAVSRQKKAYPILCDHYRSASDGRTWVVYLGNATFSDGSPVTVEDVVASYERARENDYYKYRFRHLVEVSATDDGGVAFYLDTRYGDFPLLLDVPIVKAEEVEADRPLGTGPYVFSEGAGGANLLRNPAWWCGDVEIPAVDKTIDLVEVHSVSEVRDQFQFGNVSVVCTNPMSATFAEYRCDYELWEVESGQMIYVGCNISYSDFFDDGTLRTFLTYAMDRESFAKDVYKGMVTPVTLPCSPEEAYYNKSLAMQYSYEPLKFLEKLRSYRVPTSKNGGTREFRVLVNADDSARVSIARSIASTLTELGLNAVTVEESGRTYKDILVAANYEIYVGMTRLSPTMDLTEFFRPYGELGRGGLANETLNNMALNALENSGNYYNLYKKLGEDGRIIPLLFGHYAVYAQRGLLPNLDPARDNVFFYTIGKTMEECEVQETVQ